MEYKTWNNQPNEVIEKLIEYVMTPTESFFQNLNSTLYFPRLKEFWFIWHTGKIEKYKVTDDEFKDIKKFWDEKIIGKKTKEK